MINKKGKATNKWGIIWNILVHYNKYKKLVGKQVKIIKNDGMQKYNKLVGQNGIITDFEYINFAKSFIVTFWNEKGYQDYCFALDEFEVLK